MPYRGHAFVDWDDTIAENIRYFREVEEQNSRRIAALTGFDVATVRRRGEELDLQTARRIGLVKESFGLAWTECYREFCGRAGMVPDPAVEAAIREACLIPYQIRQELHPGAAETLAWLRDSGFEVTIWTAGDPEVQRRKVRDSGLEHLVDRVEVVLDKNPERLRAALGHRDPERSFVMGNSVHSDIRPALALGLLALHIPVETWAYDHAELDGGSPNYVRLDRITAAPPVLARRFEQAV